MDKTLNENINAAYDAHIFAKENILYNDKIGFLNTRYWKEIEDSIESAQINLIETLVSFFRPKRTSTVVDVACGKGTSTKFLTKYFEARNTTGINISQKQLEVCRLIAPECNFRLMDAASLDFGDSSVDNVLCIESSHHFHTQQKFLEEVYRVLTPGGRLAMQDLLHDEYFMNLYAAVIPKENYLASVDEFRARLAKVGSGIRESRISQIRARAHWLDPFEK